MCIHTLTAAYSRKLPTLTISVTLGLMFKISWQRSYRHDHIKTQSLHLSLSLSLTHTHTHTHTHTQQEIHTNAKTVLLKAVAWGISPSWASCSLKYPSVDLMLFRIAWHPDKQLAQTLYRPTNKYTQTHIVFTWMGRFYYPFGDNISVPNRKVRPKSSWNY